MEPALIMKTSLVLLTFAALGGIGMAIIRLGRGVNPPSWLASLHGLLAGAAVTLLLYGWFTLGLTPLAGWALLILLIASATGVFQNLRYHANGVPIPTFFVVGHGFGAAVAYGLLLVAVVNLH